MNQIFPPKALRPVRAKCSTNLIIDFVTLIFGGPVPVAAQSKA